MSQSVSQSVSSTLSAAHSTIDSRYRFVRPLGQGGMGEVSCVFDRLTSTPVALKRVRLDATDVHSGGGSVLGERRQPTDSAWHSHKSFIRWPPSVIPTSSRYSTTALIASCDRTLRWSSSAAPDRCWRPHADLRYRRKSSCSVSCSARSAISTVEAFSTAISSPRTSRPSRNAV